MVFGNGLHIFEKPRMAELTTMRLGGTAIAGVRVEDPEGLEHLPDLLSRMGGEVRVLGEGSNILARDGELDCVLVTLAPTGEPEVIGETANAVFVRAGAGLRLAVLLARAASWGLSGLEGLAGIPGSVGGAVGMNAGSYGQTMGGRVHSVQGFSPVSGAVELSAEQLHFAYRHCSLPRHGGWFLVTSVVLALVRGDADAIRGTMREHFRSKRRTQPIEQHSAGCVFKNPSPAEPAGRLLEAAGMKGARIGAMSFSTRHANFLINDGNGSFAQAEELLHMARARVREHSGYELEPEVRIWP